MPTFAETLPGFESTAWYAVVAPPKTPKAVVDKINADVNEALRQPAIKAKLKNLTATVVGGSPAEAASYMHDDVERWAKVIKAAHIKLQ